MMKNKLFCGCALSVLTTVAAPAFAQSSSQTDTLPVTSPAPVAAAQSAPAPAAAVSDESQASDIIVTGSARRQRRFDVSYAVNALSQDDIKKLAPLNFADLLGKLPGIQVEPTGGEVQNITRIRGIPTDDGLAVFQQDGLTLFRGDSLNRYDLMTERVEVVRGGPAPIYASQAAAIINNITVTGTDTARGQAQVTAGTTGLLRLDAMQSGPVGDRTYYAIGGFLRRDDGHRDNGFPNDRGGQIRASLKHDFDNGSVKLTANYLNDHNVFYLPIPVADPRNPAVSLDPYIDYFHGTLNSPAFRNVNIKYLDGAGVLQSRNRDLANGRHIEYGNVGLQYNGDFDGWLVSFKGGYTKGKLDFDAFYSTTAPVDAAAFATTSFNAAARTAFPTATRLGYAIAGTNGTQVYNAAADSGLVMQGQYRAITSNFYSGQGDLSVTRKIETGLGSHDVKIGVYGSAYGESQFNTYQDYLIQVKSQPQTLDLVAYNAAGNAVGYVTDKGVLRYTSTLVGGDVDTTMYALYANDTWSITPHLRVDGGIRHERYSYNGFSRLTAAANLGDATTLADDATQRFTGVIQQNNRRVSVTNWTIGANYDVSSKFGGYVRASHLEQPPSAGLNTQVNQIYVVTKADQFEAGLKASIDRSYLYLTGFYTKFKPLNSSFVPFNPNTGQTSTAVPFISDLDIKGVEVDGALNLVRWFSLSGSFTAQ